MVRQLMLKIGKLQFDVEEYKTIVGNIIVEYTTKICLKANMIVGFYFLPTSSISPVPYVGLQLKYGTVTGNPDIFGFLP